jgi:Golgi phosphoprotein 3 (GPP34)
MVVVESLFLLMRRDDGRPASDMARRFYGLAAGAITDLVLAGRITLSDDADPRMTVLVPAPVGHPALDKAMARLQKRDGKKLSSLLLDTGLAVEEQVAAALASAGVVDVEEKRAWGLVPARYPVRDPGPERRLRGRLREVVHGGEPRHEEGAVLAILQGLGVVGTVLRDEVAPLDDAAVTERIGQVARDSQTGDAVARAMAAMNSAAMGGAFAADGGSGGDGGGGGGGD